LWGSASTQIGEAGRGVIQNKVLGLASQYPSVMVIGLKEKLMDMPCGYLSFVVTLRVGYKQSVE
jgi:hypothetical protein